MSFENTKLQLVVFIILVISITNVPDHSILMSQRIGFRGEDSSAMYIDDIREIFSTYHNFHASM